MREEEKKPESAEERNERVDANIQVLWDQVNAMARLLVKKEYFTKEEFRATLEQLRMLEEDRDERDLKRRQWENPKGPKQ